MEVKTQSECATRKVKNLIRTHELKHDELAPSSLTSDADLEHRVRVVLTGLKVPALCGVTVDVEGGVARVGGEVQKFYEKQLATHCCQRVAGVVRVVNNLRVAPRASACRSSAGRRPA